MRNRAPQSYAKQETFWKKSWPPARSQKPILTGVGVATGPLNGTQLLGIINQDAGQEMSQPFGRKGPMRHFTYTTALFGHCGRRLKTHGPHKATDL